MKAYEAVDIRNIAVVGHGDSGKTILCEAMLLCGGQINRIGSIENGTTISDYHPGEKIRQISIHATPMFLEWKEKKINVIDAPGYMDFIGEALSSLSIADMALVVVHAVNGIEVGTEQMWAHATKQGIPKILVVNGLDREHTKFDEILASARSRFGNNVFPMQLPISAGPGFTQVLDVLSKNVFTHQNDSSGKYTEKPAEGDLVEIVEKLHEELIEFVAESDDTLLGKFFEEGELSEEEMQGGLHEAVQNQTLVPLFCTSSTKNVGVSTLMDFIAKYGSSPVDRSTIIAKRL